VDGPTRRAVLATAGALALSGCLPGTDAPPARRPDPDLLLRRKVAREVDALVTSYAAVVAAFPALPDATAPLAALAAEHEAHARALRGAARAARRTASPGPVPTTMPAARAWLAGLERAAGRRRARQSLQAGPDLARLLAAIGGCEAAHAALLGRVPR
jgi:hypothetical protein